MAALLAAAAIPSALWPRVATAQTMDDHVYTYVAFDELEYAHGFDGRPIEYEARAWVGGDRNRLWLEARGEHSTLATEGGFEAEALWSRAVSAFWDLQAGLGVGRRYGEAPGSTRGLLVVGIRGLAPYWFEVGSFLYVSDDGDVSARLEAGYDLLFSQRLVLEPEVELRLSLQDVPELGVASGLDEIELGARLRYEIVRELAPYLGFEWVRRRLPGPSTAVGEGSLVAGLRWWY